MKQKWLCCLLILNILTLGSCEFTAFPSADCDTGKLAAYYGSFSDGDFFIIANPIGDSLKRISVSLPVFNFSFTPGGWSLVTSHLGADLSGPNFYTLDIATGTEQLLLLSPIQYAGGFKSIWSPKEDLMAMGISNIGGKDDFSHLYVMSADRKKLVDLTQLTSASENLEGPLDWSNDGKYILYGSFSPTTKVNSFKIIHPDGTGTKVIYASVSTNYARWSPDNKLLVLGDGPYQDPRKIALYDLAHAKKIDLPNMPANSWSPAWSPDGKCIAYLHGTGIYIYSLDTKTSKEVPAPSVEGGYEELDWSAK